MSDLRRVVVALAVVASPAAAAGIVFAGCGGDDNGGASPTGDAAPESSLQDGTTSAEASPDGISPDVGAGNDATTSDGGTVVPDAAEGGDGGTVNSALLAFPAQVAAATCQTFETCCKLDAAAFDNAKCMENQLLGGPGKVNAETYLLDGGHVIFNAEAGAGCLQRIQNVDCTSNSLTGPQYTAMLADCFNALQGTLDAGQPCNGSIECAPGNFCNPAEADAAAVASTTDSGPPPKGLCAPLRMQGQPCGNLGNTNCNGAGALEQSACSYRGSGTSGESCIYISFSPSLSCLDAGAWSCEPQQSDAGRCVNDVDCRSSVCDPKTLTCVNAKSWIDTTIGCPTLMIAADA